MSHPTTVSDITSQNGFRVEPRSTPSKPIGARTRARVGVILLLVAAVLAAACAPADEGLQEKETTTTASDDRDETAAGGQADEDTDGSGDGDGGATGDTIPGPLEPSITEEEVACLLYTSPSPRDRTRSRMPSSA